MREKGELLSKDACLIALVSGSSGNFVCPNRLSRTIFAFICHFLCFQWVGRSRQEATRTGVSLSSSTTFFICFPFVAGLRFSQCLMYPEYEDAAHITWPFFLCAPDSRAPG
mmetsp:Transcript_89153/g.186298  ORF Transcript_89153/g.186298 Transcript_89153/m.186298 type:complete len:111 (+) Transcript_89153:55-387(+)